MSPGDQAPGVAKYTDPLLSALIRMACIGLVRMAESAAAAGWLGAGGDLPFPLAMSRPRSVITIGNFDGVHVGHAALIARARATADASGVPARVVVMTFDPHPLSVLRPEDAPERLTTIEQRAALLEKAGADEVVRLEPSKGLLGLSPAEFVAGLVRDHAPLAIVEGADFRFGKGRAGDLALLAKLGLRHGFSVETVAPQVEVALWDHTVVTASSRLVRWLLRGGRVADAATVLGHAYEMIGTVVQGDRRGRTIGYPTANIRSECMAPADGVYSGWAALPDGRRMAAAISVGTKPTFPGAGRAVEAYLLDASREAAAGGGSGPAIAGLAEYGWTIRLAIEHWVRDQVRFESVGALLEQMARDCERVRRMQPAGEVAECP